MSPFAAHKLREVDVELTSAMKSALSKRQTPNAVRPVYAEYRGAASGAV
jgi:hypothetical protein